MSLLRPSPLGLALLGQAPQRTAWSPLSLFANGEQGGIYLPGNLSTGYEDSAGTTAAVADSPIGLKLDESQGLVLGSELVTNGGFDSDTWWSKTPSTVIADGVATLTNEGVGGGVYKAGVLSQGKRYRATYTIVSISSGSIQLAGSTNDIYTKHTAPGTYTEDITGDGGSNYIQFIAGVNNTTAVIDNVSVKEITGNHATQATSAMRPVLRETDGFYELEYDLLDDELVVTFPDLGTDCTVKYATDVEVVTLTGEAISGAYSLPQADGYVRGYIIVDRALTAGEDASADAYLSAQAGL